MAATGMTNKEIAAASNRKCSKMQVKLKSEVLRLTTQTKPPDMGALSRGGRGWPVQRIASCTGQAHGLEPQLGTELQNKYRPAF